MMNEPVAGESPSEKKERTVMVVWPSMAATTYGRWWGRRYLNNLGCRLFGLPVTVGRIVALLSIPLVLPVYFHMLVPRLPFVLFGAVNKSCRRYRLTNRRVVVEHDLGRGEQRSVALDRFDAIDIEVLPGQEWYPAGDLVFKLGQVETFRLAGVPRPETFRHVCLKSHLSYVGVQKAREAGVAV